MTAFFKNLRIFKSQAPVPGSFSIGQLRLRLKTRHAKREIALFAFALLIFTLCGGQIFDGAIASPGIATPAISSQANVLGVRQFVRSNPDNVLQLKGRDIMAAFDVPELVRDETPSTLWQYRTESCVLDVYFKSSDAKVENAPVVYYEVRSRQDGLDEHVSRSSCVTALTKRQVAFEMAPVNAFMKNKP